MCILVYSIIIAEQQHVGLLKCCASVLLSLSPSETDDENTRAMLLVVLLDLPLIWNHSLLNSTQLSTHLYYVIYHMLFTYVKN